jgi:putative transposase
VLCTSGFWGACRPLKRESCERQVPIGKRLQDAERIGAPLTFSAEQVIQLFAIAKRCCEAQIACEKPAESERPISHWTARELANEMAKRGIVKSISPRHVRRLLEEAQLKPHQIRYWLTPPS